MIKDKVIFILPVTSQPRFLRRIQAFKDNSYEYKIFSFQREYFEGNSLKSFISLGKVKHGNYLQRVKVMVKALFKLINYKKEFKESSVIYVFGLDNLILVNILRSILRINNRVIYENADIREVMFRKSLMGKILRKIEKTLVNRTFLTTVTSPYFITDYYLPYLNIDYKKFMVIENKLYSQVPTRIVSKEKNKKKLVIGYFGLLRSQQSWDLLYNLAKKHPERIVVYIKGYLLDINGFDKGIKEVENIIYEGEYKSPNDLAEMYSKIDISLIGNISDNTKNVKIALPNRFYESLHYRVPMIAHLGTAVSRKVKSLDVGWEMDFTNIDDTIAEILNISNDELIRVIDNTNVDKNETIGDNDHKLLIDFIEKIK